jgi:hypothetical protein
VQAGKYRDMREEVANNWAQAQEDLETSRVLLKAERYYASVFSLSKRRKMYNSKSAEVHLDYAKVVMEWTRKSLPK